MRHHAGGGLVCLYAGPQRHPSANSLANFSGVLQADAYAGFNALYVDGTIREAACWAHARRKFYDLHVARPSAITPKRCAGSPNFT
jgi:Transposase IS66 family